ncbi:hypothetical protein DOTSEDRAFT_34867 [Dothistroma septosporum NZE10]|uniref:Uncharacterized protein n=1 Tax=Dothistroma septosporum (strain NZE10 / CBS 128990) TaxID=675120 RepID=N1PM52_DOTSN|nr:hypothetical protein DOTSEDRAFT_34867 [Dothistroma septosporum NZE10]
MACGRPDGRVQHTFEGGRECRATRVETRLNTRTIAHRLLVELPCRTKWKYRELLHEHSFYASHARGRCCVTITCLTAKEVCVSEKDASNSADPFQGSLTLPQLQSTPSDACQD